MSHHHHHHGHSHSHEGSHGHGKLSEADKLVKMLEHWIAHNEEHARSYRDWAKRAGELGSVAVAEILEEVAGATESQNARMEAALKLLKVEASSH